jgi:molybdate transport system substrate-binding protein
VSAAVAALAVAAVAVVACSPSMRPDSPSSAAGAVELTVYAAASLREALADIEAAYSAAVPGAELTIATDASSTLRTQIEHGAPADVFLSADEANARALVDAGLAEGGAVSFAGNRLVVIVPGHNPADLDSPIDLARPGIKVVAASDAVPITRYAGQALANLALEPGYPADFATAVAANVVSREENVKAVVAKVRLGEGDAAIAYATDAMVADVGTIEIPATANVLARYSAVVVATAADRAAAQAFVAWLAGPDGAAILEAHGFRRPT